MPAIELKDLPPDLRRRYGVRRGPSPLLILFAAAGLIAIAAGIYTAATLTNRGVHYKVLTWHEAAPDHTDISFEVRRSPDQTVVCVLRAQNSDHVDVGYAVVSIPPGDGYAQQDYALHTNAPPWVAEVLGCGKGAAPAGLRPQFAPDAPNPEQPWTAGGMR